MIPRSTGPQSRNAPGIRVFYAVTDTVYNPGRSGIQTVVRSLAAAFGSRALRGEEPSVHPVIWRNNFRHFRPLPTRLSLGLGAEPLRGIRGKSCSLLLQPGCWVPWALARGRMDELALHTHPQYRPHLAGNWLLMPELAYRGRTQQFVDYAKRRGLRFAAIFHDAVPVQRPEFVPLDLPGNHAEYMRSLSQADLILPNSQASAEGWHQFMEREGLKSPPTRVCRLASEITGTPRETEVMEPSECPGAAIKLLCVSTLEPRKNHHTLLDAFEMAAAARPDLRLELDLVGARYVGADHIVERAQEAMNRFPGRVRWREKVEHSRLRHLYHDCDFTVYPSLVEGFGLPVIESLWFGRPCVCANFGVMAENAAAGGCLTVNVRDKDALAAGILALAESPKLRRKLSSEAVTRQLKTWQEYASEVLEAILHAS